MHIHLIYVCVRCNAMQVWSLDWEDRLEQGMAIHSSGPAWRTPMDRGAGQVMVHTESDTTEVAEHACLLTVSFPCRSAGKESMCNEGDLGSILGLGNSPGGGNNYPFQYSGLENSMDRRPWQSTVHGAAKSRMQLNDFHFI